MTAATFTSVCEFCHAPANFQRVDDEWSFSHWLEGLDGAGSDHLATWCGTCGPIHRNQN